MKKKKLKALAKKIADAEILIQTSTDNQAVNRAKEDIMRISSHIMDPDDLDTIDEMVQEILNEKI